MDVAQCITSPSFVSVLARLPDPRKRRGCRYSWTLLLTVICAAFVSNQLTLSAMAQWVQEHAEELWEHLPRDLQPRAHRLPSAATLRRTVQRLDVTALAIQLAALNQPAASLAAPAAPSGAAPARSLQGRALDGKAVRGAGTHGHPLHLVSEVCHHTGQVLQQRAVADKSNEIPLVQQMLDERDLTGLVFTLDAMHTQRATAELIVRQGGHYLLVVKDNQPELAQAVREWFAQPAWFGEQAEQVHTVSKGHGRQEWRTLERRAVIDLPWDWPGGAQVLRRHYRSREPRTGHQREQTTYALTSLPWHQASAADLESFWRGHWGIENKVHYVRDVTWREDACQCWVGNAPEALAALRNGLTDLLRRLGWTNIAQALRHYGAKVTNALRLLGAIT